MSDLPSYDEVANERHNVAEFTIRCQFKDQEPFLLPVSPADTPEQLKKRIEDLTGNQSCDMILRIHDDVLDGILSLSDFGIQENDLISVFLPQDEHFSNENTSPGNNQQHENGDEELPTYSSLQTSNTEVTRVETRANRVRYSALAFQLILFLGFISQFFILPAVLIYFGFARECPSSYRVGLWAKVYGICMLVASFGTQILRNQEERNNSRGDQVSLTGVAGFFNDIIRFLQVFLVIFWFIGSSWVFSCDQSCQNSCDVDLYRTCYWTIISGFILLSVFVVCYPCMMASSQSSSSRSQRSNQAHQPDEPDIDENDDNSPESRV